MPSVKNFLIFLLSLWKLFRFFLYLIKNFSQKYGVFVILLNKIEFGVWVGVRVEVRVGVYNYTISLIS